MKQSMKNQPHSKAMWFRSDKLTHIDKMRERMVLLTSIRQIAQHGFALLLLLFISSHIFAANQADIEKLIALKKAQTIHLDLSHADLRDYPFAPGKIDLQQADISYSNLSGVNLSKMNLGGANLSHTDLSNAKLTEVNLADANLEHANLSGANLVQSDLSRANLNFAQLISANLERSILAKANLSCANFNAANLSSANVAEANISGASFVNTNTMNITNYDSVIDQKIACELN